MGARSTPRAMVEENRRWFFISNIDFITLVLMARIDDSTHSTGSLFVFTILYFC